MSYSENLWLFLLMLIGIICVPGMDMMLVLSSALTRGAIAGWAVLLGLMIGGAVHGLYGTFGAGLLLALPLWLYRLMLTLGLGYMAYVGWQMIRHASDQLALIESPEHSRSELIKQGLVCCLLNPKAYIFIIATFPQFIRPIYGPIWQQGLVMIALIIVVQGLIYGPLALMAGRMRALILQNPRWIAGVHYFGGGILIFAAALTLYLSWKS